MDGFVGYLFLRSDKIYEIGTFRIILPLLIPNLAH